MDSACPAASEELVSSFGVSILFREDVMRTILVTGAAGFIGSNFVRLLLARGEPVKIVAYDKLTYAGNLANLQDLLDKHPQQFAFVRGDVADQDMLSATFAEHGVCEVVHFAAESHVDRSIMSSEPFVQTNIVGTQVLLDVARTKGVEKYLQVSTDEVYGTLAPNSPYSASKAAGDMLVRSYFHTHHMPVLTTRCSNNYGPYCFPEKAIPLFVTNLMEGKKIPLYGDGLNVRDWLFVEDHCDAIWTVLNKGKAGETYNIGGNNELTNRQLVEKILAAMGKSWDEGVTHVKDRPGHDRRYAIDASKMKRELGWSPRHKFEDAIRATIEWYKNNQSWWRNIKSGEYLKYYEQQYASR
jgi:dTDP-glucose 4,6-dehydratase